MPQGPVHLHEEFGDDMTAWLVLKEDFNQHAGVIYPKDKNFAPTEKQNRAIDYLCMEWDYGYTRSKP